MDKAGEAEGCCGLAGNFGFGARHYGTSMAVADLAPKPRLDAIGEARRADFRGRRLQLRHPDRPSRR
ncbi:hypothetical protein [Streptomyces canus]|uniref:hypothetical protein n=1 Tax=Streptomyces canus TaxID=58343 RepID=UPI002785C421|nr:hypothetical protein [Streptomyces canus]MDQ1072495.1 Fe-S oxidoreductase [Streptomyces canus]